MRRVAEEVGGRGHLAGGVVGVGFGLAQGVGDLRQVEVAVVGVERDVAERVDALHHQALFVVVQVRRVAGAVGDADLAQRVGERLRLRAAVVGGAGQSALAVVGEILVRAAGERDRRQGVLERQASRWSCCRCKWSSGR